MIKQTTTCLTELLVAECADAIRENRYNDLPEEVRQHLLECDKCASEVMMVCEITALPGESHEYKTKPLFPRWFRWSAAAAVVALFVVAKFVMQPPQPDSSPVSGSAGVPGTSLTVAPDSSSLPVADNKLPQDSTLSLPPKGDIASLEPNPALEKLAARSLSAIRGDEQIQVISPNRMVVASDTVSIRWKNPGRAELTLEWLNNRGKVVGRLTTRGQLARLPELQPGLYYWKLLSSDADLIYCGKLIVR